MKKTIRALVAVLVLSLLGVIVWQLLQYASWYWNVMLYRPDHLAGVLVHDVQLSTGNTNRPSIVLPKGTIVFSPEGNDYGVTAPDDTSLYKVYIRLSPKTINLMMKFPRHYGIRPVITNEVCTILEENL